MGLNDFVVATDGGEFAKEKFLCVIVVYCLGYAPLLYITFQCFACLSSCRLKLNVDESNVSIVEESEDIVIVRYVFFVDDGPVY